MRPNKSEIVALRQMKPIILVGMHRSGTSLVTRLLVDAGIHMGRRLSRDAESVFFQRQNREIFRKARGRWANIDNLIVQLKSPSFILERQKDLISALQTDRLFLSSYRGVKSFFGSEAWERLWNDNSFRWGWKDPRTSITFPIWLGVFPNAKVVHVVRNGIDVAISTHLRSLKQRKKFHNKIIRFDFAPETLDFEYSFRLWETYVGFIIDHEEVVPKGNYIQLPYENLLKDPIIEMKNLLAFIQHRVEDDRIKEVVKRINTRRLDNSERAMKYAEQIPDLTSSPIMNKLGYSYSF